MRFDKIVKYDSMYRDNFIIESIGGKMGKEHLYKI